MTPLEGLVGLNLSGSIGSIRLKTILSRFHEPQDIFSASRQEISGLPGIGEGIAERILSVRQEDIEKELRAAERLKLKLLTPADEAYPHNLKFIPDPPILLYVKGEIRREDSLSMAIVGSRKASVYGILHAEKLSAQLTERGFCVISGMARGIDTAAHRSALKSRGRTIAVMGSGFNNIYPADNRKLAQEISEGGAVISEFPLDAEPLKEHFPQRNRVISGLSLGVLVIEAARNSGALITAGFALEQGKDVFALPGRVDCENSFGPHSLIQDGAKLILGVDDIVGELGLLTAESSRETRFGKESPAGLSEDEGALYSLLEDGPLYPDEIAQKIDFGITHISDILLKLQLKKLIKQLPGKRFARN